MYIIVSTFPDLQFPSYLLGLKDDAIKVCDPSIKLLGYLFQEKLTTRRLESKWGKEKEEIDVQLNVEQAAYTRNAWVKELYSRLFDFLVGSVNTSLNAAHPSRSDSNLSVGILDIYGFEIFENNGFEQFW
jgi:myosin-1